MQEAEGSYIFSKLVIKKDRSKIQTLNGIPLKDLFSESSSDLNIITEPKMLYGNATFTGPSSAMFCNKYSFLDLYKSSYLLGTSSSCSKLIIFIGDCVFRAGVLVGEKVNDLEVEKLKYFRQHPLVDSLITTTKILKQLSNTHQRIRAVSARIPALYKRNASDNNLLGKNEKSHKEKQHDESLTIIITDASDNEGYKFSLTVCDEVLYLHKQNATVIIKGIPLHTEWTNINEGDQKQMLIFVLFERSKLYTLFVSIYQHGQFVSHQNIDKLSIKSNYQLINFQSNTVLLALFELRQLHGVTLGKLKLYRYNFDEKRLESCQTIDGIYNKVIAMIVDDKMLLILTQHESNVLVVYMIEDYKCSLYQKIRFDSFIISVQRLLVGGNPLFYDFFSFLFNIFHFRQNCAESCNCRYDDLYVRTFRIRGNFYSTS